MKKLILPLIIILSIGLTGYFFGFDTLFLPGAVKKVRQGRVEVLQKEADDAERRFKDHLESSEKAGNAYEKLGKKLLKRKDWTPAIKALSKAIGYGSGGARTHYMLGQAYANRAQELSSKKDTGMALFHYNRALEKNKNLIDAEYGIAILYFYLKKDPQEAIKRLEILVRKEPDFFQGRFALGNFRYSVGNPARALAIYESLYSDLEKKPDSPVMDQMKKNCKENISRIQLELTR